MTVNENVCLSSNFFQQVGRQILFTTNDPRDMTTRIMDLTNSPHYLFIQKQTNKFCILQTPRDISELGEFCEAGNLELKASGNLSCVMPYLAEHYEDNNWNICDSNMYEIISSDVRGIDLHTNLDIEELKALMPHIDGGAYLHQGEMKRYTVDNKMGGTAQWFSFDPL